eukprot:5371791-Pyramimonas_sp.AAC.1
MSGGLRLELSRAPRGHAATHCGHRGHPRAQRTRSTITSFPSSRTCHVLSRISRKLCQMSAN